MNVPSNPLLTKVLTSNPIDIICSIFSLFVYSTTKVSVLQKPSTLISTQKYIECVYAMNINITRGNVVLIFDTVEMTQLFGWDNYNELITDHIIFMFIFTDWIVKRRN